MVEASLKEIDGGDRSSKINGRFDLADYFQLRVSESNNPLVGAAISIRDPRIFRDGVCIGAIGPGDVAIRYGYHRYQADMMLVTVVILVIIAQLIQEIFTRFEKKCKRIHHKDIT